MRNISICLVALFLALVSGCDLAPVKTPSQQVYTLGNVVTQGGGGHARTSRSLLVSTPIANPGYASEQMKYIKTPYKIQSFSVNRWVAPPVNMLAPILAQTIRNTHYFKAVVEPPFSGITDYNLQTQLLSFEQNFQQPKSRFILMMQASLINSKTNRIMASQQFDAIVPAAGNDPFSGVIAANKAVAQVSVEIARFVRQKVARS